MSDFKNWKNKERGQNIAEKFGLKFDIDALSERGDVGFGEGEPADDEWSDKQEIELSEEEGQEEEIEEAAGAPEEDLEEGGLARRKGDKRDRRGYEKDRLREEEDETEDVSADADADALEELIRKHVRTALEELKNES